MTLIQDWKDFIELLIKHNVRYLIVGGWAVNNYLIPRVTGDIDFFVDRSSENQSKLRNVLKEFGFADVLPGDSEEILPEKKILMLGRQPNRIDILSHIDGVSFDEAWRDRVTGCLGGIEVHFISPALLLRNKKSAARSKDIGDIENLTRLLSMKTSMKI